MSKDFKPNKDPKRKGLTGGRPNIVKPLEDESNESGEVENIKSIDRMSKGGVIDMTKDKKYYKGML